MIALEVRWWLGQGFQRQAPCEVASAFLSLAIRFTFTQTVMRTSTTESGNDGEPKKSRRARSDDGFGISCRDNRSFEEDCDECSDG